MTRFTAVAELEKHRETLVSRHDPERKRITLCGGTGCNAMGSVALVDALRRAVAANGLAVDVDVKVTGCHGFCEKGPIVVVRPENYFYIQVKPEDAEEIVTRTLVAGEAVERLQYVDPASGERILREQEVPFYAQQTRVILADNSVLDPTCIDDYILRDGYSALGKALGSMAPEDVIAEVKQAGLRGRGGAGFPTARKWELCRQQQGEPKYVICNADEGDPGAYMNRSEIEGNPHLIIEGMILGAYAIGAEKGIVYCRAEYPLAIEQLVKGIAQARERGLLGENILGSGFSFDITIKQGAGAFVCGEETALMHSIEGKRGMPRPRPPYPAESGVFGRPSNINNVETWAKVPFIIRKGADWFAGIGTEHSKGTKVFSLVGCVKNTGLVEVPFGTTLREIVEKIGGGVPAGRKFKSAQIGGPSGGCLPAACLDIQIDYESLQSVGAIVGSGGLVVMDDSTCMVDLAKYFMEFIQSESCGKCIPCREGTKRMHEILESLTHNRHTESEFDALTRFQGMMELERLANVIHDTSLCGLGQTAPNPVLATLRWFRDEYEAHVYDRHCPAGACKELVGAPCETGCPVGTEVWRYVALVSRGEYEQAYQIIRQANPFPSACARVCNHPCEAMCRCGTTGGEAIAIRTLKRFVVDRVDPAVFRVDVKPATEKSRRVAVIGAGPAGLTAAHCLSVKGHRVTIFEKEHRAGGMLVCAIPEYRLPREVLDREIAALLNENTELVTGKALGHDVTVDDLLADGYDAVYVATGSHRSKTLGVPGEDATGVLPGIEFLKAFNLHGEELARGKVGIVGGGNSAIDAARVAQRQAAVDSVTVFYRRTEAEMPAYREEIEAAREEGIEIVELTAPLAVLVQDGAVRGLRLQRNELGPPDDSGRRRPVPIAGAEYEVALDTVVAAISEEPSTEGFDGLGLTSWGSLRTNPESHVTSRPGVFGGGDVVRGPNTVVDAVHDGKDAAEMIDRYLAGRSLKRIHKVKLPTVFIEPVGGQDTDEAQPRVAVPHLPVAERERSYREVELAVNEAAALAEARRCLRCDLEFTQTQ